MPHRFRYGQGVLIQYDLEICFIFSGLTKTMMALHFVPLWYSPSHAKARSSSPLDLTFSHGWKERHLAHCAGSRCPQGAMLGWAHTYFTPSKPISVFLRWMMEVCRATMGDDETKLPTQSETLMFSMITRWAMVITRLDNIEGTRASTVKAKRWLKQ
jgi:hypothetical protein